MFAALDLGTNNCRLLIVSSGQRGVRIVDNYNRVVRLGEGLYETGLLSEAAMDRTMQALHHCAARIHRRKSFNLYAVATEACRRASNAPFFLNRVQEETGLNISVISPREEVELAVTGCSTFLHDRVLRRNRTKTLLFDIGGGSTEVAWVRIDPVRRKQTLIGCCSVPVGVITLREQFKRLTLNEYYQMVDFVISKITEFERVHQIRAEILREQVQFIGVSGTVTALASMILKQPKYSRAAIDGLMLETTQVKDMIRHILVSKFNKIYDYATVNHSKLHYLLPGCAIFEAIHTVWPVEDIVVADRGIRDGIIAKMLDNKLNKANKHNFDILHSFVKN
ncbi:MULTISPECIES: Ppx/GppA phosphatase family protein [Commensalibacter]|uniref:Exopolyphosphatase n=2 Tax=Commensalibacter TaxID=1079922 RepID=W7E198_9PROT|nr:MULTISPECIES: Ppx/GppA phosphatase family protein [Commensalibacter]EUK18834.1 exopolyphosphatase [Commensalibacter papalotli (ex Servin-Garciduenas et al. 2014)]CAI3924844.1 Exopolyphosphatase/pppGpp-phosphohydrolase (GppA) (PDB:1T6C) [Commensalibacter papalotli (ex Botero et al. 2024)]CAI3927251.1 Exopolyphosphatase/pppGpp-phosphohydrolase (GppA) (PDB:1T6C) [Commensalibacter papalotli (ex Botero et al. 2024)]